MSKKVCIVLNVKGTGSKRVDGQAALWLLLRSAQ